MKSSDFKWFKEQVTNAPDETADIFYAGFLWLSLTENQARELLPIIKAKGARRVEFNGQAGWQYAGYTVFEEV